MSYAVHPALLSYLLVIMDPRKPHERSEVYEEMQWQINKKSHEGEREEFLPKWNNKAQGKEYLQELKRLVQHG